MANDAAVIRYMKARRAKLEQELENTRSELERMRARPALPTQREEYVLGEMEIVNRQLECKHDCLDLMSSQPVPFCSPNLCCCRFCSRFPGGAGSRG